MRSDLTNDIIRLTGEHLSLVGISMAIAILLGVPLGVLMARHPSPRRWVLGLSSMAQTIPSLALFGFLIPIPFIGGIGPRTVIVALVLYGLLPILQKYIGRNPLSVDAAVCDSAIAMGMTDGQLLRQVQLPLAARTIIAGIRVATVTTNWYSDHSGRHRRWRAGSIYFPRCRLSGHRADPRRSAMYRPL